MRNTTTTMANNLVDSLLAFNSADNQEFVEYLSEHLYIQSQLAAPKNVLSGAGQRTADFRRSCQKLYYAGDDSARKEAMAELRRQLR